MKFPKLPKWCSRNSLTGRKYEWYGFKILLKGFYLILGMAWFNQVELTLVIQIRVSVWVDKRCYRCPICCWIEDQQLLCLPKRQKTVDLGSYGGYVNSHACSYKDKCVTKDLPSHSTDPSVPAFRYNRLWNKRRWRGKEKQKKSASRTGVCRKWVKRKG